MIAHDIRPIRQTSIDELEGATLEPPYPTGMIARIASARGIPIGELSLGDLRLLVSQGEALGYLMPLTLERLAEAPLRWAQLYNGDLLLAALHAHETFGETGEHTPQLRALIVRALKELSEIGPTDWADDAPFDPEAPDEVDHESLEPQLTAALTRLDRARPAV